MTNPLTIQSAPGQPFNAQLNLNEVTVNTDLSCFSLQPHHNAGGMQLEYTTLSSHEGVLNIWSETVFITPFTLEVKDQCQHTSQTFRIDPVNQIATAILPVDTVAAAQSPSSTLQAMAAPASDTLSPSPLDDQTFASLQHQISQLQENFGLLQTQLNALYKANQHQSQVLETLNAELSHAKAENHLLRTLILCLGLVLLCSSYFFADWLRRHSANPKTQRQSSKKTMVTAQEHVESRAPSPETTTHNQENSISRQAPFSQATTASNIRTLPTGRSQSFPRQANDDELSPRKSPDAATDSPDSELVLKDASHFLTHGRINQAIQYLQNHLAQHPKCSPWVWLYLLDLLGREGKQQEFDLAASECRKHFNLSVERNPDNTLQGIESFSRITKALQQVWGTPAVVTLIDDLIYNTRLVPRIGFERTVFEDLMLLRAIACMTQSLPSTQQAPVESSQDDSRGLRELQQLSEDIGAMSPSDSTTFQYWSDFTFELEEFPVQRKSA